MRCASPPDSVGAERSSARYPSPTSSRNARRELISASTSRAMALSRPCSFRPANVSRMLPTDCAVSAAIDSLRKRTLRATSLSRSPSQPAQTLSASAPSLHHHSSPRLLLVEAAQFQAGAVTLLAPAVLGVEREQARIELGEAARARRTGATRGEDRGSSVLDHVHDALAEIERRSQGGAQLALCARRHCDGRDRQLDRVLMKPRQPRPFVRRQQRAVDAQMRIALLRSPRGQVRVVTLARHDERRQHFDLLAAVVLEHASRDGLEALRLDRHVAVGAELRAELDVEQAQEVIDLRQRRDRALAAAAAGALLDRNCRRDAEDRIHVGTRRGLHELARISIERFEVAALPLAEHDVERERRLARARDARHDRKAVARQLDVDVLQVVLARAVNGDGRNGDIPHFAGARAAPGPAT